MSIFFLILLIVGVVGCLVIVWRKFPQLAALDVGNLPNEKEARTKREILIKRVEAESKELQARWRERLKPFARLWGGVQLMFRRYVGRVERLWHHEQVAQKKSSLPVSKIVQTDAQEKVHSLVVAGEQALEQKQFERAEDLFISAIKLDTKSSSAYRGLGATYIAKGAWDEAKQTLEFLLRLEPNNDAVYVDLATVAEAQGATSDAIQYLEQAVVLNDALSPRFYHLAELLLKENQPATALEAVRSAVALEPKNPKYLDLLLETAILVSDKELALNTFGELRLVNPENQKLAGFKERLEKMN